MSALANDENVLSALELDDSFELVETLRRGQEGSVELVRRHLPRYGEPATLVRKRIPASLANEEAWRTVTKLDAPRLPRVREIYRLPDQLVIVYDYVNGSTLSELVEKGGLLGEHEAINLVLQLCEALAPLHEAGLVHRDVSPGNIVMSADGAHLIDLGIARCYSQNATHDTTRLGTWGFAAPEQYGFAQTDARSDVCSLGCVLAFALTGIAPGTEGWEQAHASLDARLAPVVDKAMAFEPSARYQSVGELRDALNSVDIEQDSRADEARLSEVRPDPSDRTHIAGLLSDLRNAGRPVRIGSVVLIVIAALLAGVVLVPSAIVLLAAVHRLTDAASGLLCAALAVYVVAAVAYEPIQCLLGRGMYGSSCPNAGRELLKRELKLLLGLVIFFAFEVVVVAIFGP